MFEGDGGGTVGGDEDAVHFGGEGDLDVVAMRGKGRVVSGGGAVRAFF
jgi:hypothetical protein